MPYPSIYATGTVAGGTASTLVCTSGTLRSGEYSCTVTTLITGTPVGNDRNNLQLVTGFAGTLSTSASGTIGTLIQVPAANVPWQNLPIEFTVTSGQQVGLSTVGTTAVAGTYTPSMVVTPIALW